MQSMNVWLVSPEYAPYVSVGGIGTGIRGLAEALVRRGHYVTIATAVMDPIPSDARVVAESSLSDVGAESGSGLVTVAQVAGANGIRVLLFDVPGFEPQHGVYGLDVSSDPLAARRPGLFARAVVQVICRMRLSERIDVVHAHEWPTAMVLYLLREQRVDIATIFTIHNLLHQGFFPTAALACFGLGAEHAVMERLELYGRISLLKGGLVAADRITTVSPTYAKEIQTPERGELLDGVLRARRSVLTGIVNGIDTTAWNPAADCALEARFDAQDTSGKRACKQWLCTALGLSDPEKPLVASLGRLVEQKGIDLLVGALGAIVDRGANVVIAGAGDPEIEDSVRRAEGRFPGRVVYWGRVTDDDARRLLAAADLFVMPSRWEPCGLVQLEAMRYGALPIVRRTGGLADTVIDEMNGFIFDGVTADALVAATIRAMDRLGTEQTRMMQRRGMTAALGWEGPARAYEAVYRAAIGTSADART